MAEIHTNLIVLKRTCKRPKRGDLFVCNVKGEKWLAGRVIRDDTTGGGGGSPIWFLNYIYDMEVSDPQSIETPIKPKLLIPPQVTNLSPWTRGVFQTIRSAELLPEEILPQHCFMWKDVDSSGLLVTRYEDEDGNPLSRQYDPCGIAGLGNYRWTDDRISEALGIEPAPE